MQKIGKLLCLTAFIVGVGLLFVRQSNARIIGTELKSTNPDALCAGGRVRGNTTVNATEVCLDYQGNWLPTSSSNTGSLGTPALPWTSVVASSANVTGSMSIGGGASNTLTVNVSSVIVPTEMTISTAAAAKSSILLIDTGTAHIQFGANTAKPVVSSCGTAPTNLGTDVAGSFTPDRASPVVTCTITFGSPYAAAPFCVVPTTGAYSTSTTAITITSGMIAGTTYQYICTGN